MKKIILFSLFVAMGFATKAQMKTGNNPTTIGSGQLLELEKNGTRAGLKVAEVALTSATDVSTVNIASTAVGTMVWNTATAGTSPNDVSPGFYIWEGTKWGKVSTSGSSSSGGSGGGTAVGTGTTGVMIINNSYDSYPVIVPTNTTAIVNLEWSSLSFIPLNTIGGTITNDDNNGDYITLPAGVYELNLSYSFYSVNGVYQVVEITTEPVTGGGASVYDRIAHDNAVTQRPFIKTNAILELAQPARVRLRVRPVFGAGTAGNSSYSFRILKFGITQTNYYLGPLENGYSPSPMHAMRLVIKKYN